MEMKLQNQKGFTLVEIAIVLVIIGLLLGGVLKGQELIENSKVKSVTQDFDNITAAYYSYKDRTNEIAGDDANAASDDGIASDDATFWTDLRGEGFIKGDAADTNGPDHALNGQFSLRQAQAAATSGSFTVPAICASGIQNRVAQNIDSKIDDGDAGTGTVRSHTNNGDYTSVGPEDLIALCRQL